MSLASTRSFLYLIGIYCIFHYNLYQITSFQFIQAIEKSAYERPERKCVIAYLSGLRCHLNWRQKCLDGLVAPLRIGISRDIFLSLICLPCELRYIWPGIHYHLQQCFIRCGNIVYRILFNFIVVIELFHFGLKNQGVFCWWS